MTPLSPEKNRRILVVDDNRAIHDDFRKILSPANAMVAALDATESALFGDVTAAVLQTQFEVDSAYQGQEGVLLVKKALDAGRPYAMAFVDVRMPPGWDGVETTRRIWELDPDLQVVICTAYSDYSWGEMFEKLGRRDGLLILKKPFDSVEASQLANALTEKWWLHLQFREKMEELELRVAERTSQLKDSNSGLRDAEAKYRGLFENAIEGIYQSTPEGRFLAVNLAMARIYGYERPEDLMGSVSDIQNEIYVDPARRQQFKQEIAAAGLVRGLEYQVRRRDGSAIWISESARAVRGPGGDVLYYEGFVENIDPRKRGEEALRLLGSAVEQSKESILITDAELDLPGPRIVFVNPAFTKMTGYTAEEVIGETPRILQGPHTDKTVLSRLRQKLHDGETFEGEAINYRKDGKEFTLEWQIAPIRDASGTTTHFVAIQRDITARKRFEGQLFQSQRMETVGKLAGGIAHEFNSILTAIIGQTELLLGDLPVHSPLAKNATEISRAAGRAAGLTRQLLAYGRKQIMEPETLDLNRMLVSMEGVFQHIMGGDIHTQIVPFPGLHEVKADAGQLEQVIMNMAINAREAMPHGGKFTLETANVSFEQESVGRYPELRAGDYVMLAITDTGAGMSEEVKAHVFEPFFTTKEVGEGTGLGLSTCYGIVKQSGGHISVYSETGRGATFKIYLPQVEATAKIPLPRLHSPDMPRGNETILLVEDDPALREMAGTLLRRLGYTVWAAANGIEALSLKQRRDVGHIDLLFTDVVMPHMSGKELADRVRSLYPHTRILFTSAYTENAIVHQGVLNKGVLLLQKPFTPSALARKVRDVLDQPTTTEPDPSQQTFGFKPISTGATTPAD